MPDGSPDNRFDLQLQGPIEATVRPSFLKRLADERCGALALTIREFDPSGLFERTVRCHPGRLSVSLRSFPLRLPDSIPRSGDKPAVQLRIGNDSLHSSEISFCDPSHLLMVRSSTVGQLLDERGLSLAEATPLVALLGVRHVLSQTPAELSNGDRRLVAILFSSLERCRVIVFDQPFLGLRPPEIQRAAAFLLRVAERSEGSDQILLVMGVKKIPRIWRRHPLVHRLLRTQTGGMQRFRSLVTKVRDLLAPTAVSEHDRIVTRPQRVFVPTAAVEQHVQNETIANPGLPLGSAESSDLGSSLPTPGKDTTSQKRKQLTKVTATMKLQDVTGLRALRGKRRDHQQLNSGLPTNVRVSHDQQRAKTRLNVLLGILAALILVAIAISVG